MIKEIEENKLKELLKFSFIAGYGYCSFDIAKKVVEPGDLNLKKIDQQFNEIYSVLIKYK